LRLRLRKLADRLREAWEVPRDLALGRYPDFVTGGALPRGDIPVFVFHSVEPKSFARKLRHLARNHYRSLTLEEYYRVLLGSCAPPDRAVLLTFDDGRGSLWSVGLPLLKRHGMHGVVFLVPGRMRSRSGPPLPTWEDVEAGQAKAEHVLAREKEEPLLTWEEVEIMARSGPLEFQSHTLSHSLVHVAPQVAGFASPARRHGYDAFDQPLIEAGGRDLLGEEVALGTPLLRSQPRTSEALRFFEDASCRQASVAAVAAHGAAGFFLQRGWERTLRALVDERLIRGRLETPAERTAAIHRELAESKRLIEQRTNAPVVHLCYPWHTSGPTARALAREVGYRTAFSGKVRGLDLTRAGGDPHLIARLSEDYVELLPGDGRATLSAVLQGKWARRFGAGA
jgi:peptidoglycan/xylan/chitin deacetylase (PgdA/CDA1 family)